MAGWEEEEGSGHSSEEGVWILAEDWRRFVVYSLLDCIGTLH